MKLMALDYGDRHVGVAVTDPEGKIALRYGIIDRKSQELIEEIKKIIDSEAIEKILVGVPVGLLRNSTSQTKKSEEFIEVLKGELEEKVIVEACDETFTSKEAKRRLLAEGGEVAQEHTEAARLMLEDYLKASAGFWGS